MPSLSPYQLVCDAAEERPLLILADDAQWLDRSTSGVLTFIARRLESEPVALVVAVRRGFLSRLGDGGLSVLELERLSPFAAATLLDRRAPDLHPIFRARVLAEAAGNPLALVELVRAQSEPGTFDQLGEMPLTITARLDQVWGTRTYDDTALFDALTLGDFDVAAVAAMTEGDIDRLVQEPLIIRNRAKIQATVENARAMRSASPRLATLARSYERTRKRAPRSLADLPTSTHDAECAPSSSSHRATGSLGPRACTRSCRTSAS